MKTQTLLPGDFLKYPGIIFDVRSPGEFLHARIPGAINLPLFNNDERAVVGTVYKKQGKQTAIDLGLTIVGPKLADFAVQARSYASGEHSVKVHCWRGGMRSEAMAWLLNFSGLSATTLRGGYKAFRRWCLGILELPYRFTILGGLTGTGKTEILHALAASGEQIIDLEALANHRGSSFGMIGQAPAPSNEHFENEIALKLSNLDPQRTIWIEDESRLIGTCSVPNGLYSQMRQAPLILIETPLPNRLDRLLLEYGKAPPEELLMGIHRIAKRLGGQRTQEALNAVHQGSLADAMSIVLHYYDTAYMHSLNKRPKPLVRLYRINAERSSSSEWIDKLRAYTLD